MERSYFRHVEKEIFFDLLKEYIWVVENRKNDSYSVKKKKEAWTALTNKFNAQPGVTPRTPIQLKTFWFNCKGKAKRLSRGARTEAARSRAAESSDFESSSLGTERVLSHGTLRNERREANTKSSTKQIKRPEHYATKAQMEQEEHDIKMDVMRYRLKMELQRAEHESDYRTLLEDIALLKQKHYERKLPCKQE